MVLNAALLPRLEETPAERGARVQRLAQLVKSGGYAVHSQRLAVALLDWDPRRGAPRQSAEVADRRRAYMREYMRRRRAQQQDLADDLTGVLGITTVTVTAGDRVLAAAQCAVAGDAVPPEMPLAGDAMAERMERATGPPPLPEQRRAASSA